MINRFANLTSRIAVVSAILFAIAACGGGGGGGSDNGGGFLPEAPGDDNGTYNLVLELTDSNGNPTGTLSATQPITLTVTVTRRGSSGNPEEGVVVVATTDVALLSPDNGSALTNADGIALLQLLAGDVQGAGEVTVTVDGEDGPTVETIGYQVIQAGLQIGNFENGSFIPGQIDINLTDLAAGGSARLRVAIVDEDGNLADSAEDIRFSSICSLSGLAGFSSADSAPVSRLTVTAADGIAEATYVASGCEGVDDITATLISTSGVATASINVAVQEADFIGWLTTNPISDNGSSLIALKGTGSANRSETATVSFQVCSVTPTTEVPCAPISGAMVNFSLSNSLGGIMLENTSGSTDSNGEVKAVVRSGNVSTSVFVTAAIESGAGNTSNDIIVSTGLPDQNSISLSSSKFNIDGALNIDGLNAELTVRLADKFNNPVADGTSAVFTTEYGSIQTSCITVAGACSVTWTSQNPRFPVFNQDKIKTILSDPDYRCFSHNGSGGACPDDLGPIRGLRNTILVTVVGEEFFVDSNGNGLYDEGEPFDNLPEAFIDHNEDGVYTPVLGPNCPEGYDDEDCEAAGSEETFIDFNGDGEYSLNVDANNPNGVYNGSLCPVEGDGVFCSRDLVNVRSSAVLIMSAQSDFDVLVVDSINERVSSSVREGTRYLAHIADLYNNRPGSDTTVSVEAIGDCTLLTDASFSISDSNSTGAFTIPIEVEGDGTGGGSVSVKVGQSSESFACITIAPPDPNSLGGGVAP
ncbi:MAG: hypothetical protein V7696_13845 [Halioglobus sp.]